ncbi:MAG TPA: hypothetical protein VFC19_49485 [Candidatus Limnocylindrales bacterium]|nr:hypothetical protein [Candidatus Limnocylindrales bacterium]
MSTKGLRMHLSLPEPFAAELRGLYTRLSAPSAELCATVSAARRRGWTLVSLGNALGVSRERVRQWAETADINQPITLEIPDLPPKPEPYKHVIPTLTPQQVEQLRDLRHKAMAMGCKDANHPAIAAGHEFAVMVNGYVAAGHRLRDIARELGITSGALRFRLGRWGFYGLPPSQQHGPGAIDEFRQRQEVSHAQH